MCPHPACQRQYSWHITAIDLSRLSLITPAVSVAHSNRCARDSTFPQTRASRMQRHFVSPSTRHASHISSFLHHPLIYTSRPSTPPSSSDMLAAKRTTRRYACLCSWCNSRAKRFNLYMFSLHRTCTSPPLLSSSCLILSHPVQSCLILSHPVTVPSCPILSHPVQSCLILSNPVPSSFSRARAGCVFGANMSLLRSF